MKKSIAILVLLCLGYSNLRANPTTYFTRDSLPSNTTYYILIDRSNANSAFAHDRTATTKDTYIKQLEISISSTTTDVKVGFIYDINATSATVRWFERVYSTQVDAVNSISREYPDRGLRLSQENREFILPDTADTNVTTGGVLQIYDSAQTVTPAVGDVLLKAVSSDSAAAKIDVRIIYSVK